MARITEWNADKVMRQARFALSLALTQTAKDAQTAVTEEIPARFDRPNPFTRRSIAIIPARRERLVSVVLIKDRQAEYLLIQETGGTRVPRKGSPIALPVNLRTDQFGNIGRGKIRRLLARGNVFVARKRDPRTRHLPPGIYQVAKPKGGRRRKRGAGPGKRGATKLLVALSRKAEYKPRFGFERLVLQTVERRFEANLKRAFDRAFATAR